MKLLISSALLLVCSFLFPLNTQGSNKGVKNKINSPSSTALKLNLNNISTWIYNNGASDITPEANSGFVFPRGTGKTAVYESGLVWGAKIDGQIRVGGSTYNHGLQCGKILSSGAPDDTNLVKNRVYRVRPDYTTADFSIESSEEGKSQQEIFLQYEKDWEEWPAEDGAPYIDVNENGKYEPDTDIPGVKNALQTIWFVANDLNPSLTTNLYGSQPMGIEMQATFWTYNNDFFLNNTYFRKYKLINKSGSAFSDMYISMWSDPDVGNASDDYAGCDTTLNLGFAYNANQLDAVYGNTAPPAVGFDLLQGPLVKGTPGKDLNKNGLDDSQDTAIYNGEKTSSGYINLPMTAFFYFDRAVPALEDPKLNSYEGTIQMYNFMQGKIGKTGNFFINPQGQQTTFTNTGDPAAGTGWLDGTQSPAGDRRIGLSSGPFTMASGDTQEVVIAEIAVIDESRPQSVYLLKEYDKRIKQHYKEFFNIKSKTAPEAPVVSANYTKEGINITWQQDSIIENFSSDGFEFEGYSVYQLPNGIPNKKNAMKLVSYDIKNGIRCIYGYELDPFSLESVYRLQQCGDDTGIQRAISLSSDFLGQSHFIIGKKYFYAVSAYTYREDSTGMLTYSESPMRIFSVVYQDSLPGLKYLDTLKVVRISGSSGKLITAVVVDPSKITGHDYEIGFEDASGTRTCYLKDITLNKYLTRDLSSVIPEDPSYPGPAFDGVSLIVEDARAGMKDYAIPSGTRKWSYANANYDLEGFSGAMGMAYNQWFSSSTVTPDKLFNVLIKFAETNSAGNITDSNNPNASFAYRYLRRASAAPEKPEFAPFIKNPAAGYAFQDYTKSLPFAAYNEATGQRLMVGYLENNVAGGLVDGKYWPPSTEEGIDNASTEGPREWFFVYDVPYAEMPDAALSVDILNNTLPMVWYGTPTRRGASNVVFSNDDQFLIIKSNPFSLDDKFSFKTGNLTSVKSGSFPFKFELSQNYPNPFNPRTQIRFSLAEKGMVTLRVYSILGQMVGELINSELGAGLHKMEFDGRNLASGIYIYKLDVKDKFHSVKKMVLLK